MRVLAASVLAVLLVAAMQSAPPQAPHVISGNVFDRVGIAVSGATVELRVQQRVERQTTTDSAGAFRFENVAEGAYEIHVTRAGFVPLLQTITVGPNPMQPLRIQVTAALAAQ